MKKQKILFWSVYIFMLVGIVTLLTSTNLLSINSFAESMIFSFFLLLLGYVFKKWFDEWYPSA